MDDAAQYLTYPSQESKFVSSNPATLNAFSVGDLLIKPKILFPSAKIFWDLKWIKVHINIIYH